LAVFNEGKWVFAAFALNLMKEGGMRFSFTLFYPGVGGCFTRLFEVVDEEKGC